MAPKIPATDAKTATIPKASASNRRVKTGVNITAISVAMPLLDTSLITFALKDMFKIALMVKPLWVNVKSDSVYTSLIYCSLFKAV